ncbi:hypothetical protein EOE48_05400 [Methylobacterium oryzihabitans]|uniref:Uncharacterized protein n=1 Tax=Methylobacterium oryzihabitans TaxID=2499852 RepID=A0A437PCU2_9HYPH|nr:hypothetical protein EOE48_05400 [Methylobacterium oryzihabitans]
MVWGRAALPGHQVSRPAGFGAGPRGRPIIRNPIDCFTRSWRIAVAMRISASLMRRAGRGDGIRK